MKTIDLAERANRHNTPPSEMRAETAKKLTEAIGVRFGVSVEDFSLFRTVNERGDPCHTVAYVASLGIDLGNPNYRYDSDRSWDGIFDESNSRKFIVEVDGEQFDVRKGMTLAVYQAFIESSMRKNRKPLPDSIDLMEYTGGYYPSTWLTGENELSGNYAPTAQPFQRFITGIRGELDRTPRSDSCWGNRFRPAAIIA